MPKFIKGFSQITKAIAGGLLAAIFLTFLLQILLRYFFTPAGWTLELIGILWVWLIFFSCAFVVRESDHVKFDILYLAMPLRIRKIMAIISAFSIVIGMIYIYFPTWDYIDWMKMRSTTTVKIPFIGKKIPLNIIFSVYGIFLLSLIIRYVWKLFHLIKFGLPDKDRFSELENE